MTEYPKIATMLMTKESEGRDAVVAKATYALAMNLAYPGEAVFVVACSGSQEYYTDLLTTLQLEYGESVLACCNFLPEITPGVAWNWALKTIFDSGIDIYLRLEDDFVLKDELNIDDYVKLLMDEEQNVGMVRLGLMPINLKLFSTGYDGNIYFNCLPSSQYAYSGNPGLVHRRLHDHIGFFHEGHNPGNIEVDFDYRYRDAALKNGAPRIVWPLNLGAFGTYGPWDHIGNVKSY